VWLLSRRLALSLIVVFCIPTCLPASGEAWTGSYEAGIKLARELRRPVLLDFAAWWCGSCLRMEREVYAKSQFVQAAKNLVLVRVDVDHDPRTASAYKIRQIPTVIFIDPWGTVLVRRERRARLGDMLEMIKALPATMMPAVADLERRSGSNPNPELLLRVGSFYLRAGFPAAAHDLFERASEERER